MNLKQNLVSISTIAGTVNVGPDCEVNAVISTNKESSAIASTAEAARRLLRWKRQE